MTSLDPALQLLAAEGPRPKVIARRAPVTRAARQADAERRRRQADLDTRPIIEAASLLIGGYQELATDLDLGRTHARRFSEPGSLTRLSVADAVAGPAAWGLLILRGAAALIEPPAPIEAPWQTHLFAIVRLVAEADEITREHPRPHRMPERVARLLLGVLHRVRTHLDQLEQTALEDLADHAAERGASPSSSRPNP